MWNVRAPHATYLDAAAPSNLEIRRDLLLQVAGRSPQSLRDRLSTLRRSTPDLQTAWQQIDVACARNRATRSLTRSSIIFEASTRRNPNAARRRRRRGQSDHGLFARSASKNSPI